MVFFVVNGGYMGKVTVVLEYEDVQVEPTFYAGMIILGGLVVAVQLNDALEELERIENEMDKCIGGG